MEDLSVEVPLLVAAEYNFYYSPLYSGLIVVDTREDPGLYVVVNYKWYSVSQVKREVLTKQARDPVPESLDVGESSLCYAPGGWSRYSAGHLVTAGTWLVREDAELRYDGVAGADYSKNSFVMFPEGTLTPQSQSQLFMGKDGRGVLLPDGTVLDSNVIKSRWSGLDYTNSSRNVNCALEHKDGFVWLKACADIAKGARLTLDRSHLYVPRGKQCQVAYGPMECTPTESSNRMGTVVYQYGPKGVEGITLVLKAKAGDAELCNVLCYTTNPTRSCLAYDLIRRLSPTQSSHVSQSARDAVTVKVSGASLVKTTQVMSYEILDAEQTPSVRPVYRHTWFGELRQTSLLESDKDKLMLAGDTTELMDLLDEAGANLETRRHKERIENIRRVTRCRSICAPLNIKYYMKRRWKGEWTFSKTVRVVVACLLERLAAAKDEAVYGITCCRLWHKSKDQGERDQGEHKRVVALLNTKLPSEHLLACTCMSDAYQYAVLLFEANDEYEMDRFTKLVGSTIYPYLQVYKIPALLPFTRFIEINDLTLMRFRSIDAINNLNADPDPQVLKHVKQLMNLR